MAQILINGKYLAIEQYYGSGFYTYLKELLSALADLQSNHIYTVLLPKPKKSADKSGNLSNQSFVSGGAFKLAELHSTAHLRYVEIEEDNISFENAMLGYAKINGIMNGSNNVVIFLPHWDIPKDFWNTLKNLKKITYRYPKIVTVIHDLIPTLFLSPRFLLTGKTPLNMITLRGITDYLKLKLYLNQIDLIVTISKTSAQSITTLLGDGVTKKIVTIPPAIGKAFTDSLDSSDDIANEEEILKKYNLKHKEYLIYFGGATKRKNLYRLASAYKALHQEHLDTANSSPLPPLVMVGCADKLNFTNNSTNTIRLLGKLPEAELITVIRGAKMSIYPTLYEGFGLPVLESIALGTLPLLSDIPAHREFFVFNTSNNDNGKNLEIEKFFFNPYQVKTIADCIKYFLNKPESISSSYDTIKSILKNYSWTTNAGQLNEVFSQLTK